MSETTRVYRVTHAGDGQGLTTYHMAYGSAVLALREGGYEMRRHADPDANITGWATRTGMFGAEDAWIGWVHAQGRCPACEAAELARILNEESAT
jgi:hypothetical protein